MKTFSCMKRKSQPWDLSTNLKDLGGQNPFFNFIGLLVVSIVASMLTFSFLEGVILTIPDGVGWLDSLGIKLSFSPVQLKLSFG